MNSEPLSTAELLKAAKSFQTKKRLGQHLLVDADVLKFIGDSLLIEPSDTVVEIGCGTGFLTRVLSCYGAEVVAVDLDRESTVLVSELALPNVRTVHGDFLNFDLGQLALRRHLQDNQPAAAPLEPVQRSIKLAGNVPFQITGLIIGHVLGEIGKPAPWLSSVERIVLTIQHEVALRMVALPGSKNYSQLSLMMQYFCRPRLEMVLGPEKFHPPPKVTSAVVSLEPLDSPPVQCDNHVFLRRVIAAGFSGRRKMLRNALNSLAIPNLNISLLFSELGLDPQARAENLSLAQFALLTNAIEAQVKIAR